MAQALGPVGTDRENSAMTDLPLTGVASTYASNLEGGRTSSGDTYRHALFTAATLPKAR